MLVSTKGSHFFSILNNFLVYYKCVSLLLHIPSIQKYTFWGSGSHIFHDAYMGGLNKGVKIENYQKGNAPPVQNLICILRIIRWLLKKRYESNEPKYSLYCSHMKTHRRQSNL